MSFMWPVVPICDRQKLDIDKEDLILGGLFRKCNIYKGGGGYDKFVGIYKERLGYSPDPTQFVVQLRGCPLECWYCYVTKQGVFGEPKYVSSEDLIKYYMNSGLEVFHLMGGAPALYLEYWKEISGKVKIFHSDFLLIEKEYNAKHLTDLPGLHAVSLKDLRVDEKLMFRNLDILINCNINFYLTFTGNPIYKDKIKSRYGDWILKDALYIDIVKYKAIS